MTKPRRGRQAPRTGKDFGQSEIYSRCSPLYFHNGVEEIKGKMSFKHGEAIKSTPFASYFNMSKMSGTFNRVEAILRRFQPQSSSFILGDDIEIAFMAREFGIVMGLQHVGQPVDIDLKIESDVVKRLFSGKFNNVTRVCIYKKLLEYVDKDSEKDLEDFARLYILFVFNCILFPMSNYSTPSFLLPYVDDLAGIGMYAWGDATYNFLLEEMKSHLGGVSGEDVRKKYFDGCTIGMMAWIYEHVPSLGSPKTLRSFPHFFRWVESKIPNNMALAEEKFRQITRNKVMQIYPFAEEERLLAPLQVHVEVPNVDVGVFEAILKEKDRKIAILREKISSLQGKLISSPILEKDDEKIVEIGEEEKVKNDEKKEVEDEEEEKLEEEVGSRADSQEKYEEGGGVGVDNELLDGAALLDDVISFIVRDVQTRHDRVKKKKDEDFEKPPGTTMPSKRQNVVARTGRAKRKKEEATTDSTDTSLEIYRGRADYKGQPEISKEEQQIIEAYLSKDDLSIIVWKGCNYFIHGDVLCGLLFGQQMRSDLIDCYIKILCSPSVRSTCGHDIWCMNTAVMFEVLALLEKRSKKRTIKIDEFPSFIVEMRSNPRRMLEELTMDVINKTRFILIPLHSHEHWFLLIFDTVEKKFIQMNSMWSPQTKGTAKIFAKFLSGCLYHSLGYDTGKPEVNGRYSRQQTGGMDCGVYLCLWAECFARDTSEFWAYSNTCTSDEFRARMAAKILGHEHGLLSSNVL